MMNVNVFKDTYKQCEEDEILKNAIKESIKNQSVINQGCVIDILNCDNDKEGKVILSAKRSLEAASQYAKEGKKVCVLNFANALNPGGGVKHGSSAQEEAICRCSTLYKCLDSELMWQHFYEPHRTLSEIELCDNFDCIYTPAIKVFKSDTDRPEQLPKEEWYDVDIITCAAPDLNPISADLESVERLMKRGKWILDTLLIEITHRIERIFQVAIKNHTDVLILGAFGCGAFKNPPRMVSGIFSIYTKKYRNYFDVIEYAVYHREHEIKNYEAFEKEMRGLM